MRTVSEHPKMWGRIRRRALWSILSGDELTELKRLTPSVRKAFLDRVDAGSIRSMSDEGRSIPSISVAEYLRYCSICYKSAYQIGPKEEPVNLYRAFADGRDGGLLALPRNSGRAFAHWFSSYAFAGSHPFEIVRDSIVLSVHTSTNGGYWLRLGRRCRDFVSPELILMALGLSHADVAFRMENLEGHRRFAHGADWVGVAVDAIWEEGHPVWPPNSGILNVAQNSFLVSELSRYPSALRQVRWFNVPVKVRPYS